MWHLAFLHCVPNPEFGSPQIPQYHIELLGIDPWVLVTDKFYQFLAPPWLPPYPVYTLFLALFSQVRNALPNNKTTP